MKIELRTVKVRDLIADYKDAQEKGVTAWGGLLDVRPAYQREFIYKDRQRDAVIDTLSKGFPLNTMYWVKANDGSGRYEVLDGQQRAISICQFFASDFSHEFQKGVPQYAHSMPDALREKMLDYELTVYFCEGTDKEKLEWFRTINIAGEKLTDQELLNINYTGPWLSDAKKYFSQTNGPAYRLAKDYVKGTPNRQELLETALDWISDGDAAGYMSKHRNDRNASELWNHFASAIEWAKSIFPAYRKEMKGLDWGRLYREYSAGTSSYDPEELEKKVSELMANEEVTDKKGVYEYLLSGEAESKARRLSKRAFPERDRRTAYERQKGVCPVCGGHFEYSEMEADHVTPWWRGGLTVLDNCQMLCAKCNAEKAGRPARA